MNIRTIESEYDYRMQGIMERFLKQNEELSELNAEELQDKMWEESYAVSFAHMVMEDMQEWSGDDLFEEQ